MISVSNKVAEGSFVIGRNGIFDLSEARIIGNDHFVRVLGVGKRGVEINAGLQIDTDAAIELFTKFLEMHGYEVTQWAK